MVELQGAHTPDGRAAARRGAATQRPVAGARRRPRTGGQDQRSDTQGGDTGGGRTTPQPGAGLTRGDPSHHGGRGGVTAAGRSSPSDRGSSRWRASAAGTRARWPSRSAPMEHVAGGEVATAELDGGAVDWHEGQGEEPIRESSRAPAADPGRRRRRARGPQVMGLEGRGSPKRGDSWGWGAWIFGRRWPPAAAVRRWAASSDGSGSGGLGRGWGVAAAARSPRSRLGVTRRRG